MFFFTFQNIRGEQLGQLEQLSNDCAIADLGIKLFLDLFCPKIKRNQPGSNTGQIEKK